jgi:hypothetical protein
MCVRLERCDDQCGCPGANKPDAELVMFPAVDPHQDAEKSGDRNGHFLRLGTEGAVRPARVTALREGAA